jgi:SAM-dependent methyltransferase
MTHENPIARYFSVIAREGMAFSPRYTDFLFRGISFKGARVLDIGGGAGLLSFYAACAGAARVVCLEPEAEGADAGIAGEFRRLAEALAEGNVSLSTMTLQEFDPGAGGFDVVILNNSINHLDEHACVALHGDAQSRRSYQALFGKIRGMQNRGGVIVIAEQAPRNLFRSLGVANPFTPRVEWHKHQSPYLWRRVMESAGYVAAEIRWEYPLRLGGAARALMSNRVAAFFYTSRFLLRMRVPAA